MNALLRQAPNILSALRLVAAPIAAYLILRDLDVAALCVFVLAGLSDALDGFLAKRYALTSRFGAWLDPAADKFLMLASFVTLTMEGAVPLWLTVLVIGRDVAIVLGVGAARLLDAPLRLSPLIVGKASTVAQILYIAFVLLQLAADVSVPRLIFAGTAAVTIFTMLSFFAYGYVWLQAVAAGRRAA
ncbi:MAG: CDP-alcohol phosphatidyltransferase family protein [Alphaproteobacteria bacterium]|nr:CDP-alcohol phosphatidyltransferase family protein [Alphaproteobacteria bacterium]